MSGLLYIECVGGTLKNYLSVDLLLKSGIVQCLRSVRHHTVALKKHELFQGTRLRSYLPRKQQTDLVNRSLKRKTVANFLLRCQKGRRKQEFSWIQ